MKTTLTDQPQSLLELAPLVRRQPGFDSVLTALREGNAGNIDGAWGSACALVAAVLAREGRGPLLIVLPRMSEVDDFAGDLEGLLGETPLILPAWEALPRERTLVDAVFGSRLRVLRALRAAVPPRVVVTSFPALLQPVPSRAEVERGTRTIRTGETLDPEELLRWFLSRGFERVTALEFPGEFSMHGGIIDVYPPDAADPLRLEFFGDEVESIRKFDVATQRTIENLREVQLTLVGPARFAAGEGNGETTPGATSPEAIAGAAFHEHLVEALPSTAWIALVEPADLVTEGGHYLGRLDDPPGFYGVQETLARCMQFPHVSLAGLVADTYDAACHLPIEPLEKFTSPPQGVLQELALLLGPEERALIACHNAGERQRLGEMLAEAQLPAGPRIELCEGRLARGFRIRSEPLIVLSDHELFGRRDVRRVTARHRAESRAIDSFLELSDGELVVHLAHGIARYRGMKLLEKGEQVEEHLILEFRDAVMMYVPTSLIHLVQKYIGGSKSAPLLSKIGGNSWERKKQQVAEAVQDMAGDMIRLQAEREQKTGIAYPPDSRWQQEFEDAFPYTPTTDQVRAIEEIKGDMIRPRPMDRLICGDVGYGKTEVAMRAAFKAIDAGKQVAVLVPTTVLAEQHFRSFGERMAEYPFTIDVISRFRTKAEQNRLLENLKTGGLDLVIGTHRLVQPDVRFHDLGLLVIDEEQRFGVEAKERLKQLRLEVDVLTLSATPIPRTLHLSLLGIRDISNLQTPPQDRLAIETRTCRFDAGLVRQAVMREMNRGGQVYFVHNRVYDIELVAARLQQIVPEARIAIVHGQMSEHPLEEAMLGFVAGEIDILVATTIIESGLDIPNANTIFIHEADKYGLADLHQLRGRVGRYKHRAYCYLLLEEGKTLTSVAAKRLKAIEEFSELGAGFKISMRDLEIRGAGNILGTEQSGHIAAVGYELYCQLLEDAARAQRNQPVRQLQHVAVDLPVSAYLPGSWIPPGRQKIEAYRKLSRVDSFEALEDLLNEFRDRFGPAPAAAELMFELKRLQLHARTWQIDDIHLEDRFAVFGYRNSQRIRGLAGLSGGKLRIVDQRWAYLLLDDPAAAPEAILSEIKAILQ